MQITLLTVGKIKEKYLAQGIAEYMKRLRPYAKVAVVEVPDEKAPETMSEAEEQQVRERESRKLLDKLPQDAHLVALALDGKTMSSEELATHLNNLGTYGQSSIVFAIGGSLGLSPELLQRADLKLAFGRMTFPHQLMRLILLEQLYRSFKINRGEPYHK